MRDPGEAPQPDELPGYTPDELPVRGPQEPGAPQPATDAQGADLPGGGPDLGPAVVNMPQGTM
jgi:hypothetical protein